MFFCFIGLALAIVIHESGHALAAALVGFRIFRIQVGRGRPVWEGRIARIPVSLHELPLSGWVSAAPSTARFVRGRAVLFVLGGVLMNLAVAAAFFLVWQRGLTGALARLPLVAFFAMFWSNLLGILNLFPRQVSGPVGRTGTDGLVLLQVLFSRGVADQWRQQHYVLGAHFASAAERWEESSDWATRGLALFPDSFPLLLYRSVSLGNTGRWNEARELSIDLLARTHAQPFWLAMLKNNIAWFDFLLDSAELRSEAARLSEEALAAIPWHPALLGTRGAVLLAQGKPEEALQLLATSVEPTRPPRSRADNLLLVSMAHAARGDSAEARRNLDLARSLAPDPLLLKRAESACAV